MALPTVFIPEIWSASVLRAFEKASVFGSCLSRAYQGDAVKGNTVKVPKVADVAIRDYTTRSAITYDNIDGSTVDILIDQQSYFGLKCEDIERTQAAPDFLDAATASAGYGLRDKIDIYTAGILDAGAGILTDLGTTAAPLSIKAADVWGLFALLGQKLDEANVPHGGRWAVIPPWLHKKLVLAKVEKESPNSSIVSDGYVGRFLGFDLFVSNNVLKTGVNYSLLAGVADCGTEIVQINETETLRDPAQFGDLVRGLCVYTAKVLQGSVLAKAVVAETAES
jgi:hypothetical protein